MRIIVNADDFGRSHSRNIGIVEAINGSLCTQTTIMVNMPETDAAVLLAKTNDFSDKVGLHINLTLGEPLTAGIRSIRMYCHNGEFLTNGYNKYRRLLLPAYIGAIREELEAQIKRFINYGFTLMHVDSHNWVHLSFPVWIALKPLLHRYGFRSVRGIRPGLLSEGSVFRNTYYSLFKTQLMRNKDVYVSPYASNIEQFAEMEREILSKQLPFVEVFTHPELIDGIVMDNSYSYKGNATKSLEENTMLISSYEKTDYRSPCS